MLYIGIVPKYKSIQLNCLKIEIVFFTCFFSVAYFSKLLFPFTIKYYHTVPAEIVGETWYPLYVCCVVIKFGGRWPSL